MFVVLILRTKNKIPHVFGTLVQRILNGGIIFVIKGLVQAIQKIACSFKGTVGCLVLGSVHRVLLLDRRQARPPGVDLSLRILDFSDAVVDLRFDS